MKIIRTAVLGLTSLILALSVSPAKAQSWLDLGKKMLNEAVKPENQSTVSALTSGEIVEGLKEALKIGSERVVSQLGAPDGFNGSSDVHIPLPQTLQTVHQMLSKVGLNSLTDDVELRLNRAAEAAVPKATNLFLDAISQMSFEDANGILNGPKDAATQYFQGKMSSPLARDMRPIVDGELAAVGAIAAYDNMITQYKSIPFVPDARANLTEYVLKEAIDGVFLYLAREEAAIRENPAKRTTELLQKVFTRP